jgi:replicative DNA helicase
MGGYDSAEEFARTPPHDIEAERWVLGGIMNSRQALTLVVDLLEPEDFYRPAHQMIYVAMVSLFAQGIPLDPVSVRAELDKRGETGRCGGPVYIADLYGLGSIVVHGTVHHAEIIREKAGRRKIIAEATRLLQASYSPEIDLPDLVGRAQAAVAQAMMSASDARSLSGDMVAADVFMRGQSDRQAAVIPGLLDHQDRVIIVGWEGDGKSTLSYQVAVATSAGVHPFAWQPIPPQRVLVVDLENPPHMIKKKLVGLQATAERHGTWDPSRLTILAHPEGVDLTRTSDQFRLMEAIRQARPDLIVTGPILKMMQDRGQRSEELHSQVTQFWDQVRARYGPALWFEHHAAKSGMGGVREMTPFGSAVYMRWPEFGFGLARGAKGVLKLKRFRGDREEGRPWPESLTRNRNMAPCWPWLATYPTGTFQARLDDDADEEPAG